MAPRCLKGRVEEEEKSIESVTTPHLDLPHFLSVFEAKIREYFENVCDHFLVPANDLPEMVQLVFGIELLTMYSMSEAGSEKLVCFGASLKTYERNQPVSPRVLSLVEKLPCTETRIVQPPKQVHWSPMWHMKDNWQGYLF